MSRHSKPFTLAKLEDVTLGAFAYMPTSETLDHFIRYVSTSSGNDKFFAIIQYSLKLLVPFLHFRARMQHRAGLRTTPTSGVAERLAKFGSLLGDFRTLANIWGLLPIIRWLTTLERNPPPTRKLHTIERLQGWSMLLYYPFEHVYWLLSHQIIPSNMPVPSVASKLRPSLSKPEQDTISLNAGAMSRVSVRFWALYIFLQFFHLREDRRLLKIRERALGKSKAISAAAEKQEIKKRWEALYNELFVTLSYLPLTIHWSLEKGLFQNERNNGDRGWLCAFFTVWVGIFGLAAALGGWRSGWKATALPPANMATTELDEDAEKTLDPDIEAPVGLDAGLDEI